MLVFCSSAAYGHYYVCLWNVNYQYWMSEPDTWLEISIVSSFLLVYLTCL